MLAELARTSGAKFITLVNRLGVSRDSLRHTLRILIEDGLAQRNPGYGHPLRPEYILTPAGHEVASAAAILLGRLDEPGRKLALNKWTLPLLCAVGRGASRFNELKQALPGVTSRALTMALKELTGAGWLTRAVDDGFPPSARYAPGGGGAPRRAELAALAEVANSARRGAKKTGSAGVSPAS